MTFNHCFLIGTIFGDPQFDVDTPQGLALCFEVTTDEHWQDRTNHTHPVRVAVRLLDVPSNLHRDLAHGVRVLIEGRLHRWSTGRDDSDQAPVTGVDAERMTITR